MSTRAASICGFASGGDRFAGSRRVGRCATFGAGHAHAQGGAVVGHAGAIERAAEQMRALAHAAQTKGFFAGLRGRGEAQPVIDDVERDQPGCAGQGESNGFGLRVAGDIGEGFLRDAEDLDGGEVVQLTGALDLVRNGNAVALAELLGQPEQPVAQPEIEHGGPELGCDATASGGGGIHQLGHAVELRVVGPEAPAQQADVHFQRGEQLAEFVVHVAGEAGTFLLACALHVRGHVAQIGLAAAGMADVDHDAVPLHLGGIEPLHCGADVDPLDLALGEDAALPVPRFAVQRAGLHRGVEIGLIGGMNSPDKGRARTQQRLRAQAADHLRRFTGLGELQLPGALAELEHQTEAGERMCGPGRIVRRQILNGWRRALERGHGGQPGVEFTFHLTARPQKT